MIDGEVVPFYDPVQHRPIDHAPPGEEAGELLRQLDRAGCATCSARPR
jgi:hypothetical protein